MNTKANEADDSKEDESPENLWYHFLAKGWECPGHDDSYESSSCIGAQYVD